MFVIAGFGLLALPFYAQWVGKRTAYVVTDTRALIIGKRFKAYEIQSFEPDCMNDNIKKIHKDGSGDIIFRRERYYDSDGDRQTKRIGFEAVPDVNEAERAIRELLERHRMAKQPSSPA